MHARCNRIAHVGCDVIGRVEKPAHHWKVNAQISKHAGILRTLAGKQKRHALGIGANERLIPEIDSPRVSDRARGRVAQLGRDRLESARELCQRRRDDPQAGSASGMFARAVQGVGDILECLSPAAFQPITELTHTL